MSVTVAAAGAALVAGGFAVDDGLPPLAVAADTTSDATGALLVASFPMDLKSFAAALQAITGFTLSDIAVDAKGRVQFQVSQPYTAEELGMTAAEFNALPADQKVNIIGVCVIDPKNPDDSFMYSTRFGEGGGKLGPQGEVLTVKSGELSRDQLDGPYRERLLTLFNEAIKLLAGPNRPGQSWAAVTSASAAPLVALPPAP